MIAMIRDSLYAVVMIIILIGVLVFGVARGFMVNSADSIHAAQEQGFSDVVITQELRILPGFAGCDSGDAAGFHMTGVNTKGEHITFTACSGWPFKGITIRY
jgi:hypothetical protein